MSHPLSLYKKIDSIGDIESAAVVHFDDIADDLSHSISDAFGADCNLFQISSSEAESLLAGTSPDILLITSLENRSKEERFDLCRRLRKRGYEGVILLVTDDIDFMGGTRHITSVGFDNYLLKNDDKTRLIDNIQWAILNRRRRNKFSIQFDNNPDMFFTVDRRGRIYDLNDGAAAGSNLTPKDIVNAGKRIDDLASLKCFKELIQPLIKKDNIDKVFSNTYEEGEAVAQVKTKIHNVSTIGLVATIVKTDITEAMYSNTMDILINSVTLLSHRDNYTASHSARVFYYASCIADKMGLLSDKRFIRDLYIAALLHDIGKIGVRDHILLKEGKLDDDEFADLAQHPIRGYELIQHYSFLHGAGELVRCHHERPDGRGYPDGLKGDEIPLGASIIAVADGFDAMTTCRPYRNSLDFEKVIAEIRDNLGVQFNKEVGEAFLSQITHTLVDEVHMISAKPLSEISREVISTILN